MATIAILILKQSNQLQNRNLLLGCIIFGFIADLGIAYGIVQLIK